MRWRRKSGPAAAEIRALQKPPVAAWAINQVYWRGRPAFHALEASAAALRAAHTAVVSGKRADLRAAGKAHDEALEAVLKAALAILRDAGQPATDATKQAIATTLRALPASTDPPGRLTRILQPTGFELMAGLSAVAGPDPACRRGAAGEGGQGRDRGAPEKYRARQGRGKGEGSASRPRSARNGRRSRTLGVTSSRPRERRENRSAPRASSPKRARRSRPHRKRSRPPSATPTPRRARRTRRRGACGKPPALWPPPGSKPKLRRPPSPALDISQFVVGPHPHDAASASLRSRRWLETTAYLGHVRSMPSCVLPPILLPPDSLLAPTGSAKEIEDSQSGASYVRSGKKGKNPADGPESQRARGDAGSPLRSPAGRLIRASNERVLTYPAP